VPAPLDFGCEPQAQLEQTLPAGTLAVAAQLRHWICENARSTRAYLKRVRTLMPQPEPLQTVQLQELPRAVHKKGDRVAGFDARPMLAPALAGHDLGLVCEAGMPAVADPGASVVRAAHELGIPVRPLVGPSALLLALAASGLDGQSFAFVGYLPQDPAARAERVRALERLARRDGQAQLFIETPYRNPSLWDTLLRTLAPGTRLAVASGLTLPQSSCCSATVARWRERPPPVSRDTPAVFALG